MAEPPDTKHYLGSHWIPFVEDAKEIFERLPAILEGAVVQQGYSSTDTQAGPMPAEWPEGYQMAWPRSPTHALSVIVAVKDGQHVFASMFPLFDEGSQHTVNLRQVRVWDGGLEAQIKGSVGPADIEFFDTRFVIDRAQYVAGQDYEFILAGIAYVAGPAEKHEWQIERHPDVVAWINRDFAPGEKPHERQVTANMDEAAVFLPICEWDIDDYSFHGPVKSVIGFEDWLGQSGWCVRTIVMRDGDEDIDLAIVITARAWTGDAPPQVGQNIEGNLWLQRHLGQPLPRRH